MTSPLFLVDVALNSWASRDYLHSHGWGLMEGRELPWPSMLALGPHGWAQVLGFFVAGAGVLLSAPALARALPASRARVPAALSVAVLGLGVLLSAAPVDASMLEQRDPTTWHGAVHGLMFLVVLLMAVLVPLLLAAAARGRSWRAVRWAALGGLALEVGLLSAGLGNLGFYLFMWVLLGGLGALAVRSTRKTS